MNILQVELVQRTFALAAPDAGSISKRFYARLFELDPALRSLFPDDMTEQEEKLMTMLAFVVHGLGKPEQLSGAVRQLGQRHVHYGVQTQHYNTVGEALLNTLAQHFGPAFTAEVKDAWTATYTLLAGMMQESSDRKTNAKETIS